MIANGNIPSGVQIKRNCPIDRALRSYHDINDTRIMASTLLGIEGLTSEFKREMVDAFIETFPYLSIKKGMGSKYQDIWAVIEEGKNGGE